MKGHIGRNSNHRRGGMMEEEDRGVKMKRHSTEPSATPVCKNGQGGTPAEAAEGQR